MAWTDAARLASAQARAAKAKGRTKSVRNTVPRKPSEITLYHRTSPGRAANIVKTQKFSPKPHAKTGWRVDTESAYFHREKHGPYSHYGKGVVSVKVPRSAIRKDPFGGDARSGSVRVPLKALKGRKIRNETIPSKPRKTTTRRKRK